MSDVLKIKIDRSVVQSNSLIKKQYHMTLREKQLLMIAISMIDLRDLHRKKYKISIKEILEVTGAGNKNHSYTKATAKKLSNREIPLIDSDGLTYYVDWLDWYKPYPDGTIEIRFSEELEPLLYNLKKHFSQYKLGPMLKIKNFATIRLYELLNEEVKRLRKQLITYNINDLKKLIGIETKYKLYGHLKNRILNPAKEDINKYTDLKFDFKEKKIGKRVVSIDFIIDKECISKKEVWFDARSQKEIEEE